MTMLVTLQQASDHLRRDTTDDDADLTLKIMAASAAVINYLKSSTAAYETTVDSDDNDVIVVDTNGDPIVKDEVRAATLLLVGVLYKGREGEGFNSVGNLPMAVQCLLYPLRDPAVA